MKYRIEITATSKAGRYNLTIREDAVYVLYVRHTARDELRP